MRLTLISVLLLFAATIGQAQQTEVSISGGVSRLSNAVLGQSDGSDVKLDNGFRMAFRLTLNPNLHFGHEIGYAYSRTGFLVNPPQDGLRTSIHTGSYGFLAYATKEGSKIRPFAVGGGHFSNFVYPGYSALSGGGQSKVGVNYGAGVKIKTGEIFMLRLDARQYLTGKPFGFTGSSGALRQNEISIGFGIGL